MATEAEKQEAPNYLEMSDDDISNMSFPPEADAADAQAAEQAAPERAGDRGGDGGGLVCGAVGRSGPRSNNIPHSTPESNVLNPCATSFSSNGIPLRSSPSLYPR